MTKNDYGTFTTFDVMRMAKYRKKPVVIEAVQWFEGEPWVDGMTFAPTELETRPVIWTLEGSMVVSSGDWIITDVNGEKYPCKPDIFERTYEAVNG